MKWRYLFVFGMLLVQGCSSTPERKPRQYVTPPVAEEAIDVVWYKTLAEKGHDRFVKNYPYVSGDAVYTAEPTGIISKFDAISGKLLWRSTQNAHFSAGPVVHDDMLLVGTVDAEVFALNPQNGELIWRTVVSSEVLAPPQRAREIVVVQSNDGKVTGLRASDGQKIWVYSRGVPVLSLRGTSSPLIVGEQVMIAFASSKLVSLALHDGKLLWETSVAVPKGRSELERMVDIDAYLQYQDGTIYVVGYQGRVAAVALESGRILWSRDISSYQGLAMSDNVLYLVDSDARVWALDRGNGATLWMQDTLLGYLTTAPSISGDKLYLGDVDGNVYWLSTEDGKILGRIPYRHVALVSGVETSADDFDGVKPDPLLGEEMISTGVAAPLLVNNGKLLVSYHNGVLVAFSLVQGKS